MHRIGSSTAALLLLGSSLCAAAPAQNETGRRIVTQGTEGVTACATCHGANGAGNADSGFPRLSILNPGYLRKQLQDYAAGTRQNATMQPFAQALSKEQVRAVSEYFAAQHTDSTSKGQAKVPALGEQLALRGAWDKNVPACVSCHGPGGRGVGESFPALAGQHASYIRSQIQAWKSGTRRNDPNSLMKGVAERLSEQEIDAVSAYFAALPAGY